MWLVVVVNVGDGEEEGKAGITGRFWWLDGLALLGLIMWLWDLIYSKFIVEQRIIVAPVVQW